MTPVTESKSIWTSGRGTVRFWENPREIGRAIYMHAQVYDPIKLTRR